MEWTLSCFRFCFNGPLHLSKGRLDYGKSEEFLHSDALVSAIAQVWAEMGHEDWIPQDAKTGWGFTCSSLFPYQRREKGFSYYFPKPYRKISAQDAELQDPTLAKAWKKLGWLDQEAFQQVIAGQVLGAVNGMKEGYYHSAEPLRWGKEQIMVPFITEMQSRNQVGSELEDTKPFYTERIRFSPEGGLFGLFSFETEEIKKRVIKALDYLQYSGLGTDRNVGNGRFTIAEENQIPLEMPTKNHAYGISLSLLLPESHEEFSSWFPTDGESGYEVIKRGGWISEPFNQLRRKQIWMIREGSVLKLPADYKPGQSLGSVADLAPPKLQEKDRKVWRSGSGLIWPASQILF